MNTTTTRTWMTTTPSSKKNAVAMEKAVATKKMASKTAEILQVWTVETLLAKRKHVETKGEK